MSTTRLVSSRYLRTASRVCAIAISLVLVVPIAEAKNGAFKSTLHGNPDKGPNRRADKGRGTCSQCHGSHEAHGQATSPNGKGLFTSNDNNLCFSCHATQSENGIFPGPSTWQRGTHGFDPRVSGGGSDPSRPAEANRCTNCHDPHGNKDRDGVVPALLHAREPEACLVCHDGTRGADIGQASTSAFEHGRAARGNHDSREGSDAKQFGSSNRHVGCSDCHNVHVLKGSRSRAVAPEASALLAGVSRVQVVNGGAGQVPSYVFRPADDLSGAYEYEVCFKCHSSWTNQPARQADLAVLTNPANASFHPVQAPGRNEHIHPDAFVNGYDARSQVACTECHGSGGRTRGLHGSSHEYLLRARYETSDASSAMQKGDLCFLCHSWDVYAERTSDVAVQQASRFNRPAGAGHVFHVSEQRVPCYSCHETHGSARHAALISAGKGRGITSFTQTANGGTCTSRCHGPKTYTVNYAR